MFQPGPDDSLWQIVWCWDFSWLRKTRTDRQTDKKQTYTIHGSIGMSYFQLKRVQNNFEHFLIRLTPSPLKKMSFFYFFPAILFVWKYSLCPNVIVLYVEMRFSFFPERANMKNTKIGLRHVFKLARIRPRAKISWRWDFWWLRKTWTTFMFFKV